MEKHKNKNKQKKSPKLEIRKEKLLGFFKACAAVLNFFD